MLFNSVGLLLVLSLSELIKFHRIVVGGDNLIMVLLGIGILLSLAIAGYIAQDVTTPVKLLIQNIKNYQLKKEKPDFGRVVRDDEFGYVFQEFKQMIDELEARQTELVKKARLAAIGSTTAMVAHDVRQPLASMKALLHVLPYIKDNPQEIQTMLAEVENNITLTNAMLDEILDFSRESEELELKEESLEDVITTSLSNVFQSYPKAQINIEYNLKHENHSVLIDAARIGRVFVNIMSNAFEAMADKVNNEMIGTLSLTSSLTNREGCETVMLVVADTGCGLPGHLVSKIFDPFFTYGKKSGSGLGLPICQKIMIMHNGSIVFRNRIDGNGAECILHFIAGQKIFERKNVLRKNAKEFLSFWKEKRQTANQSDIENALQFNNIRKQCGRVLNLLIVDDEPFYRGVINILLNQLDPVKGEVKLLIAKNAAAALMILKEVAIDYIIIDLNLGKEEMNGYELTKKVLDIYKDAYVIISSNKDVARIVKPLKKIYSEKFLGFVPKPITSGKLLQFFARKSFIVDEHYDDMTNKKVLLLNDDKALNLFIQIDLRKWGADVYVATDFSAAFDLYQNNKINFVISDVNLSDTPYGGYDFLTAVRKENKNIPFIVISAYDKKTEWPKAQKLGADAYVQVPFNFTELKNVLEKFN